MNTDTIPVMLEKQSYDIILGTGILASAGELLTPIMPSRRAIVVADASVATTYAATVISSLANAGIEAPLITLHGGEESKCFAGYEALMNQLLALNPDRKTTLIAIGGGVIGDLVGFAASTLLRGVPLVQIPTTLLAQVDSAVGGKTGINTSFGKNLIGSFYQPHRVLIDVQTLQTLPKRELLAGYAEIVKYAVLGDDEFMHWLEENGQALLALDSPKLHYAIKLCLGMKADIVEWDAREQNMRALLNLGHTFGHALEAEAGYNGTLLHGEAVAIGMVMAARLSNMLEMCDASVERRIKAHLKAVGLPSSPNDIAEVAWDVDAICRHFSHDKKALDGNLAFVLLHSLGDAMLVHNVPADAARSVVEQILTS